MGRLFFSGLKELKTAGFNRYYGGQGTINFPRKILEAPLRSLLNASGSAKEARKTRNSRKLTKERKPKGIFKGLQASSAPQRAFRALTVSKSPKVKVTTGPEGLLRALCYL